MLVRVCSIMAVALFSFATSAHASPLKPIENWDIDYGETQCTAARSFGTAADPLILGIVPSISGNTYELLVSSQQYGPKFAEESQGSVSFGKAAIPSWMLHYGGNGVKRTIDQYRITAAQMEQARSAIAVELHSSRNGDYAFALSDMPALLDGLRKCTEDLQQYWNMNRDDALARPAVGDMRSVFKGGDYPSEAVRREQQGTAQYQLLVDEKGAVAGCDVLRPSGIAALDSTGCEVIKERAKFSPAIDKQGKPVRSVVTTPPVQWRMSSHGDFFF
jgi:TonB family protein